MKAKMKELGSLVVLMLLDKIKAQTNVIRSGISG